MYTTSVGVLVDSRSVLGKTHAHEDLPGICVANDGLRPVPSWDHLSRWYWYGGWHPLLFSTWSKCHLVPERERGRGKGGEWMIL